MSNFDVLADYGPDKELRCRYCSCCFITNVDELINTRADLMGDLIVCPECLQEELI